MYPDIPEEQSVKLRPTVEALLSAFITIEQRIPRETDFALIFTPLLENET